MKTHKREKEKYRQKLVCKYDVNGFDTIKLRYKPHCYAA